MGFRSADFSQPDITVVGGRPSNPGKHTIHHPCRNSGFKTEHNHIDADVTLINLNLLFMRYSERIERERHIPLGLLYLSRILEDQGFSVDFRDYQMCLADDPFDMEVFLEFCQDPAPIIGLSCMANLLPFTILAIKALKERYPQHRIILGGVGAKAVEKQILDEFPWIDLVAHGEGERNVPKLIRGLQEGIDLSNIPGIFYRDADRIICNPSIERINDLDTIPFPAWNKVNLSDYAGYGMMTSRGCPYPCTFCSVAPVWGLESYSRSAKNIVSEMLELNRRANVELFLFQDEFFISGKAQVMAFCRELKKCGLNIKWKAFGRVNLVDKEMMEAMRDVGCIELRFGIESGSDRILQRIKKGFTASESLETITEAVKIIPQVDAFFIWGFPFETMDDFYESLTQMVVFRHLGARILPSMLSLLPQTDLFQELSEDTPLEFCSYLMPEFVFTGHEIIGRGRIDIPEKHKSLFNFIQKYPRLFSGFHHVDIARNILPKLELLRTFGFYPMAAVAEQDSESCGAHSPQITMIRTS